MYTIRKDFEDHSDPIDNNKNASLPFRDMSRFAELTFSQAIICGTLGLGSISIGVTISYSAPAIESLKDRNVTGFPVSDSQLSWIASIMPLCAIFGSLFGGQLVHMTGRKMAIFSMSIPGILGWTVIATAINPTMVLVGRALTGIAMGIAVVSYQVYVSETIHTDIRGSLGVIGTLTANAGIVMGYALGTILTWYQIPYFVIAVLIPYSLLTVFVLPETPRWYLSRERPNDAKISLKWLRRKDYDVDVELTAIRIRQSQRQSFVWAQFKDLTAWENLKPLLIVIGTIVSGQFCGVNCIIFYNVSIFKMSETDLHPHLCAIITGCGLTVASIIPVVLVERVGRKALLLFSGICISIIMLGLATFLYVSEQKVADVHLVRWLPLVCLLLLLMAFASGYGPVPYLLMGELLPMPIRGIGSSIVSCINSLATFVIIKSFFSLVKLIHIYGVFWMYSIITFLTILFMIFIVPETSHMTLEEIQVRMSSGS